MSIFTLTVSITYFLSEKRSDSKNSLSKYCWSKILFKRQFGNWVKIPS